MRVEHDVGFGENIDVSDEIAAGGGQGVLNGVGWLGHGGGDVASSVRSACSVERARRSGMESGGGGVSG